MESSHHHHYHVHVHHRFKFNFLIFSLILFSSLYPLLSEGGGNDHDYFTSIIGLEKLVKIELDIVTSMTEYVTNLENRYSQIKRYLEDYEQSILESKDVFKDNEIDPESTKMIIKKDKILDKYAEKVAAHPIMTYRLIRRFVDNLSSFEKELRNDHDKKFLKFMEKIRKGTIFPGMEDVNGAMEGLIRIQDSYNLDIEELSQGVFDGLETQSGLRAVDIYRIGNYTLNSQIYTRAIQWLERAFILVTQENDKSIEAHLVGKKLAEAIEQHNEAWYKRKSKYIFRNKVQIDLSDSGSRKRRLEIDHVLYIKENSIHDLTNFARLCRGEKLQPPSYTKQLKCTYETRFPFYVLDPLKVEILHLSPRVVQIYEVLTENQVERLLMMAKPLMSRAKVQGNPDQKDVAAPIRTSTTAWIPEVIDPITASIPKAIERITGLNILPPFSAEDLQISNYGIGGHYNPHFDRLHHPDHIPYLSAQEKFMGDRIATMMFYLSDVERGGGTAFPKLGVMAQPVKGSAIFWNNLLQNGDVDYLSLHGGCPVIFGNKWVANKWIRGNNQIFTRKCGLNPDV